MTTSNPPLLRNAAFTLPIAVVMGAFVDADHAVAAAISGGVVLANLWALSVLGPRVVMSIAKQQNPGLWVGMLGLKFAVLTAVIMGLTQVLPPLGVCFGFVPLLLGVLITGIQMAQEEAQREAAEASGSDPTAPGEA